MVMSKMLFHIFKYNSISLIIINWNEPPKGPTTLYFQNIRGKGSWPPCYSTMLKVISLKVKVLEGRGSFGHHPYY